VPLNFLDSLLPKFQGFPYQVLTGVLDMPTPQAPPSQPVSFLGVELDQTLLPEGYLATPQPAYARQTQAAMQGTLVWVDGGIGQDPGRVNGESSDDVAGPE
jgi:hypothetical protein